MNIKEIVVVSFLSVKSNKLRTLLTILGIVVGIFSIIVIMTIITMLQNSIESGLAMLNKNTFQIQKFPAMQAGGPGSRDKYRNRKDLTMDEFDRLNEILNAMYIGAEQWEFGKVIKFGNKETNPNISVSGVTTGAMRTNDWNVESGRDLRFTDIQYSNDVCILGPDVADKLFPGVYPVGQIVRVDGRPLNVIAVLESQPAMFGDSRDNFVVMPITTFQSIYGRRSKSINITVMSYSKEDYDNTGGIKIGAMVVSIIALLAAGVGIMNIMLVSVTERTREIGIRKAVGARRSDIMMQFLTEALTVTILGGLLGIAAGVGAAQFMNGKDIAGLGSNVQTVISW